MGSGEDATLDFRILGSLEVVCDERPIPLKPAKARALLALLLLEPGRPVSADRLIDELWGDEPPESAGVSLRVLVSRLREALAAVGASEVIVTRTPGYALNIASDQIDAQRFEARLARGRGELGAGDAPSAAATLRDALALWRGPALADVADPPAAAAEATRLEEMRLMALEERIQADLACGRHDLVLGELESLVRAHPFRERLWAARMVALYRCGRQAEALAAFTELRERLVEELGIEPGPELRDLQAAVLAHDPKLAVATKGPGPPPAPAGVQLPTGVVTFLLTDIGGSSALWEREPKRMATALERHDELVVRAVTEGGGVLVKARGEGDSTFSVFARASDAVVAALELRAFLAREEWPEGLDLQVRLALHTGEAREREGDYLGATVNRAARLRSLALPGQVLLSQTTAEIVGDHLPEGVLLVDLGRRGLRGHERDEHVYELRTGADAPVAVEAEFRRELPSELTSQGGPVFVGRDRDRQDASGGRGCPTRIRGGSGGAVRPLRRGSRGPVSAIRGSAQRLRGRVPDGGARRAGGAGRR
jgi:DNA-binding SARP family transcriptional activator